MIEKHEALIVVVFLEKRQIVIVDSMVEYIVDQQQLVVDFEDDDLVSLQMMVEKANLSYSRPIASLADQIVDRQQGYRYRNYNPQTISNDQSTTYSQTNSRAEKPMINSLFQPSYAMKPSRRLQNQQPIVADQQQYAPIVTQQPIVSDQQYSQPSSQPWNQQPQPSVIQGPPQRSMFRMFQSLPSRMADDSNTQSTSSSYRR